MILAAREVNAALQQRDMDRLFYAIQNLLNAAANVSKALGEAAGNSLLGGSRCGIASVLGTTRRSEMSLCGTTLSTLTRGWTAGVKLNAP
jgi:hypothetical protein